MKSGAMEVLRNIRVSNAGATDGVFQQVACELALSLESRFLYYITSVAVAFDTLNFLDQAAVVQWQICRGSKSAIVGYEDSDVLWKGGLELTATTSGQRQIPMTENIPQFHPYAVAAPTLYFGVLGTGVASAFTLSANLSYYPQKVTQNQFWEASQTR